MKEWLCMNAAIAIVYQRLAEALCSDESNAWVSCGSQGST
jgi:hypothetical protein